jgi:hypothetical protein
MHRDDARIQSPCHEDWASMDGNARKRFCSQCAKHVHHLSAMPELEAVQVLASEREVCVRYSYDARSGGILFADSPRRTRPRAVRVAARAAMAATALLVGGSAHASGATRGQVEEAPSCERPGLLDRLVDRMREVLGEPVEPVLVGEIEAVVAPMGKVAIDPTLIPEVSVPTAIPEVAPPTVVEVMGGPKPVEVLGVVQRPPEVVEVMGDYAPEARD